MQAYGLHFFIRNSIFSIIFDNSQGCFFPTDLHRQQENYAFS